MNKNLIKILIYSILVLIVFIGITKIKIQKENKISNVEKVELGKLAPDINFIELKDNKIKKLSEFKGNKIMLWFFATWCPSCINGIKVLSSNNEKLSKIKIIALINNLQIQGPSLNDFIKNNAPEVLNYPNWILGEPSLEAINIYAKNYPDIYFLIDENGYIKEVNGAPAVTIDKIVKFAQ